MQAQVTRAWAIAELGGSIRSAANAIGVSYHAVYKWPEVLPQRISDRVLAALARKHLPPELISSVSASGAVAAGQGV